MSAKRGRNALTHQLAEIQAALERLSPKRQKIRLAEYSRTWLAGREGEISASTLAFYRHNLESFTRHAAAAGIHRLDQLTQHAVAAWRASRAQERTPSTANQSLKALRALLKSARRQKLIAEDPSKV